MVKKADSTDVLLSSSIYDLEPILEALCSLVSLPYRNIMALEDMHLSEGVLPEGIY